jgi:type VI secretion system IcmF/VasK family protein
VKPKDLIYLAVLLAMTGGVWFGGSQIGLSKNWVMIIAAVLLVVGLIVWLVMWIVSLRRSAKIEKGLQDKPATDAGPGAAVSSGGEAEMQEQFNKYLAALKASPTGKTALGELPWYMVIGAPGSGKTTALQESGLAFSSMGHGLRSIRGVGGTRNCDWWFADNAILLDTAGRYTTQPEDHGEWLKFLDMVRESRGRRALNGIIVTVSVGDLIKGDPSAIAGVVRPIRERIIEVSNRLKLVLPVYVIFSKADLIGGFKDFFAGFNRAQRDQVWGSTVPAGERRPARDIFAERISPLLTSLQARRTAAVSSGSRTPAQLAKLTLMPGNFAALQKWFGEFVGELFAPMPLADQPAFRGFYFTSGIQVPRPGEKVTETITAPASHMPTQEQVDAARAKDMSVFFLPGAEAPQAASDAADSRRGLFLKDLFARVIIPDRHLAGIPAPLVRRARLLRLVAVFGSLALGVVFGAMLTGRHVRDQQLIARAVEAGQALATDPSGKGAGEAVGAVERARSVMADAVVHGGGTGKAVIERLDPLYGSRIATSFIKPASERIGRELDDLRRQEAKDATTYDRIFDLFRAYQMLGGAIPPDRPLLERLLIDEGRWFAAAGGTPSDADIRAAKAHLALIEAAGANAKGWQARIEPQLVSRVESSLGGALWIQQSFADTVASMQGGTPIGRDRIVSGPLRDLIEIEAGVPTLFTPEGWEGTWLPAMSEKADSLRTRYAGIKIDRTVDEIRGRLRSLYGREYNTRWLRLLAGVKPAPFADLAQASTRLRQLAGEDSPYRTLVKNISEFARVDFNDPEVRVMLPTDGKWVDEGLKAMIELQGQIDRFLQGTQSGSRGKDATRLAELCAAADKAKAAFDVAAGSLENEQARTAAASCLANVLDAVHRAVAADLGSEIDRAWASEVAKPFADQLAGKFPFDMKAVQDAPLGPVAKLWNPKSGALWQRVTVIEQLRQTRFAGKELLPTSLEYQRLLGPARQFRDAFFAGGSEDPAMAFTLTLVQRESVKDMSVAIGKQTFGLYDRPNRRYRYEWKLSDGGGSKVSLNLATGQWITKEYPAAGWGILRMLRDAAVTARPEGGLTLTWIFPHQGTEFRGGALLEESVVEPLVSGDGLGALTPPAKVSP